MVLMSRLPKVQGGERCWVWCSDGGERLCWVWVGTRQRRDGIWMEKVTAGQKGRLNEACLLDHHKMQGCTRRIHYLSEAACLDEIPRKFQCNYLLVARCTCNRRTCSHQPKLLTQNNSQVHGGVLHLQISRRRSRLT